MTGRDWRQHLWDLIEDYAYASDGERGDHREQDSVRDNIWRLMDEVAQNVRTPVSTPADDREVEHR